MSKASLHAYSKTATGRLVLLGAMALAVGVGLAARGSSLSSGARAEAQRKRVESLLVKTLELPTLRGRILDRHGEVLAVDAPGWDLAVDFRVLSGEWASSQALRAARQDPHYIEATDELRARIRDEKRAVFVERLTRFWEEVAAALDCPAVDLRNEANRIVAEVGARRNRCLQLSIARAMANGKSGGGTLAASERAKMDSEFLLPEQQMRHVVAKDLTEIQRARIQDLLDAALLRSDEPTPAAQTELKLRRVRRYPFESMSLTYDRQPLPPPLNGGEPLKLKVEGIGIHLLGWLRRAQGPDVLADPVRSEDSLGGPIYNPHGLREGDDLGEVGVERAFDQQLRGTPGRLVRRIDPAGGAEKIERITPSPGADVTLAMDIHLQARLDAAVSAEVGISRVQPYMRREADPVNMATLGERIQHNAYVAERPKSTVRPVPIPDAATAPLVTSDQLCGAVVVLDARTAEVMAATSFPHPTRERLKVERDVLWADAMHNPMRNRFAAAVYQPGSIIKPLVLGAAITEGVYQPGEIIDFPGYLWVKHPNMFQDFMWRHSKMTNNGVGVPLGKHDLAYGLAVSSTPVFGLLAQTKEDRTGIPRLGPQRTLAWLDRYGFGQMLGVGLCREDRGDLGDKKTAEVTEATACWMVVGQGPISVSPLQMATAYARMLTGDLNMRPTLEHRSSDGLTPPRVSGPMISDVAVDFVLKGMGMAVAEPEGTLHETGPPGGPLLPLFRSEGVKVWGKSGTAQTGNKLYLDLDGDKKNDAFARSGDMAWTVALCAPAGESRPRYIVVAFVEWGGSGGRVAGPIAAQAVQALKVEGYLEKERKD